MGKQPDPLLSDLITRLRADLETVTRQRDAILMQARIWSGEAKSQKATVDQVGAILGGVPDWGPIAAGVEKLRADLAASQAECERLRADAERYGHLFWLAARDVVFFSTYNEDIKDWDNGWHAAVNCNDTFYYASADATHLAPGRECEVRAAFDRWEWAGVVAWCAIERGEEPLEQLRTEKYRQARAAIDAARAGKGE